MEYTLVQCSYALIMLVWWCLTIHLLIAKNQAKGIIMPQYQSLLDLYAQQCSYLSSYPLLLIYHMV